MSPLNLEDIKINGSGQVSCRWTQSHVMASILISQPRHWQVLRIWQRSQKNHFSKRSSTFHKPWAPLADQNQCKSLRSIHLVEQGTGCSGGAWGLWMACFITLAFFFRCDLPEDSWLCTIPPLTGIEEDHFHPFCLCYRVAVHSEAVNTVEFVLFHNTATEIAFHIHR